MLNYFIKRVLGVIPTLLIAAVLVFLFVHLLPGDPVRLTAGPETDETVVNLIREDLGPDKPMYEQFVHFLVNVARGEFGNSIRIKRPVSEETGERFWSTLDLTITSMVWAVVLGAVIGITSAVWCNKWPDRLGMMLVVSGISFPIFALGMLLMEVFPVQLGWLPSIGVDSWKHYILLPLTLGTAVAVATARFICVSLVEVLQEDFVRTACAKGVRETVMVIKYCLRNAMISAVTMTGLQFGFLLGGSIVVEKVFSQSGFGRLLANVVEMRDYLVIQAEMLLFSLESILTNLMVDTLYTMVNSTTRHKKQGPIMTQVSNPATAAQVPTEPVRTPWMEFWHKFRKQHLVAGAGVFVTALAVIAVLAPHTVSFDPENYSDYDALNAGPLTQHWFGVDPPGRDIFSCILMGTRISLETGSVSVIIGAIIGTMSGLLAGYHEGWWDRIVICISDVLFAFPGILLAIGIVAILGNGMINVIFAVAVFNIPTFARLVRGSMPMLKHLTYVEAAHNIGASDWTTIMRHTLPSTISSIVMYSPIRIDTPIIIAASLSFLGPGAQPLIPERGVMPSEACADMVTASHTAIFPSLAIFLIVLAFNPPGDGLRDVLDPRIDRR